jgi:hypothetical protein
MNKNVILDDEEIGRTQDLKVFSLIGHNNGMTKYFRTYH